MFAQELVHLFSEVALEEAAEDSLDGDMQEVWDLDLDKALACGANANYYYSLIVSKEALEA